MNEQQITLNNGQVLTVFFILTSASSFSIESVKDSNGQEVDLDELDIYDEIYEAVLCFAADAR